MSLQRQPKKRAQLSIDNKREICEYARQHPTLSHTDIAHYFNEKFNLSIDRSTVKRNGLIHRRQNEILAYFVNVPLNIPT